MPRKPDERIEHARELYLEGAKLVSIAEQLGVSEGTVRSWKSRNKWDCNVAKNKCNVAKKKTEEKNEKEEAVVAAVDQVLKNPNLTDKQRLFCVLYVRCFNATRAYQKAYRCSYETALTNGSALLKNVRIKNEIKRLKQNRLNREMIDENDIFQRYMDIAFADITDYVTFGREMVQVMDAFGPVKVKDEKTGKTVDLKKEVNVVKFHESTEVDGTVISEVKQGKDGASIKLADRMKALQWLSDHMGMATEEQKARIEQMKAQTNKLSADKGGEDDDGVEIINDAPKETGENI